MRAFWSWLAKPVISIADCMTIVTVVIAADVLKVTSGLPWWAVLLVTWAGFALFAFSTGFIKGFCRSMRYDVKRWKAGRGR